MQTAAGSSVYSQSQATALYLLPSLQSILLAREEGVDMLTIHMKDLHQKSFTSPAKMNTYLYESDPCRSSTLVLGSVMEFHRTVRHDIHTNFCSADPLFPDVEKLVFRWIVCNLR